MLLPPSSDTGYPDIGPFIHPPFANLGGATSPPSDFGGNFLRVSSKILSFLSAKSNLLPFLLSGISPDFNFAILSSVALILLSTSSLEIPSSTPSAVV